MQAVTTLRSRLYDYAVLMRWHRPIGSLLLLWPTLWALWMAGAGRPSAQLVLVFVAGVFIMRSAGCVINDFADRNFDPHVKRTRDRPIAAGRVTPREAIVLFLVLCAVALVLAMRLNRLAIALAPAGAFLAASYPFTKRFTQLPQFYLGVAFGWGIPMAFAAQSATLPAAAWVMLGANIVWAVAYDTEYAMVDRDDDIRIGVKSTAILFGRWDRALIGISHVLTIVLLAWCGTLAGRGMLYYSGLAAAGVTAVYQQLLIRSRDRERCFRAFMNNNYFGAAVFVGLLLDYYR